MERDKEKMTAFLFTLAAAMFAGFAFVLNEEERENSKPVKSEKNPKNTISPFLL